MARNFFKNIPLLLFLLIILGPILGRQGIFILIIALIIFYLIKKFKNIIPDLRPLGKNKERGSGDNKHMAKTIDLDSLKSPQKAKRVVLSSILIIFLIWLFFASIQIIDAGYTGVYSLFGKVRDKELSSGFHLVIPLAKVTRMSIRTEEYTMSIAQGEGKKYGADAITSLTKEGLSVDLDMTVLYRVEEDKASEIYKTVGMNEDIDEKIIRPTIRTAIRDVIAQYEAKDIYSEKREEAAAKIFEKLKNELEPRGIIVEQVLLRNVALPANLANAIQEKLQAEQEAEKYDFILEKEKKEKQRKIIEAEGQRDAQKIINESLTQNYLYYLYINDLKDRQGTIYVPTNPATGMPLFRDIGG